MKSDSFEIFKDLEFNQIYTIVSNFVSLKKTNKKFSNKINKSFDELKKQKLR